MAKPTFLKKQWDARYACGLSAAQSGITVALCLLIYHLRHGTANCPALSTPEIGSREPSAA
jgi:hypothetical protein